MGEVMILETRRRELMLVNTSHPISDSIFRPTSTNSTTTQTLLSTTTITPSSTSPIQSTSAFISGSTTYQTRSNSSTTDTMLNTTTIASSSLTQAASTPTSFHPISTVEYSTTTNRYIGKWVLLRSNKHLRVF